MDLGEVDQSSYIPCHGTLKGESPWLQFFWDPLGSMLVNGMMYFSNLNSVVSFHGVRVAL